MVQRIAEQWLSPGRQLPESEILNADPPIIYTSSKLSLSSPPLSPEKRRQSPLKPSPLSFAVDVTNHTDDAHVSPKEFKITAASPGPIINNDPPSNQAEIDLLKERNCMLEAQIVEVGKELARVQEREAEAQRVTNKLQEELEAVRHNASQVKTSFDAATKEVTLWKNKYEDCVDECRSLQSKIESTATQADVFDSAVDSLKADLASAEQTIQNVSTKLAAAIEKDHAQSAKLAAAVEENAVLSRENRRLTQDAAFLAQQLQQLTELLHRLTATPSKKHPPGGRVIAEAEAETCVSLQERDLNISAQVDNQPTKQYAPEMYESAPGVSGGGSEIALLKSRNTDVSGVDPSTVAPPLPPAPTPTPQTTQAPLQAPFEAPVQAPYAPDESNVSKPPVQSTVRHSNYSHFDSAKALMHRAAVLEDALTALNVERGALEAELAHMPCGTAGRTGAQRRRKVEVELRLGEVVKEMSGVKRELKSIGAM